MGLVPYLFYAIPTAGVGALTWWGQRKAKAHRKNDRPMLTEIREETREIHEQAVNSHKDKDNLRDQVDRLESTVNRLEGAIEGLAGVVSDGFQGVNRELGALQKAQELERLERIAGDARGH